MDSAKAAVKDFMSKAGKHDTTVHETVNPAVMHETTQQTQHENVTTAVDKETHQDHYHTSVQPVKDREVLPEQHHHNVIPVEHRSFDHGNKAEVEQKLAAEQARFQNESTRVEGQKTHSVNPIVAGEHVHHHVHENIQPVVEKQTIEPHVVHTTVPIHETHHNAAQHHSTSALPAVSMADFQKQGGTLGGREERMDGFEGAPRAIGSNLGGETGSSTTGTGSGLGHESSRTGTTGAGYDNDTSRTGTTGSGYDNQSSTGNTGKPSMMDKLNPKKDADGDGKAGFMK